MLPNIVLAACLFICLVSRLTQPAHVCFSGFSSSYLSLIKVHSEVKPVPLSYRWAHLQEHIKIGTRNCVLP